MFISIDGGDGVGKTSQIRRLQNALTDRNFFVLTCRDPGSTPLGEAVRSLLLSRQEMNISAMSEMLLFMAARAQMLEEVIRPALEDGKIVIADRFLLSTLVYQGYAGGLEPEKILSMGLEATSGIFPDLTILLDLDPEIGFSRIHRPLDRMEMKGIDYHRRVREGFLAGAKLLAEKYAKNVKIIDASQAKNRVSDEILETIFSFLKS